MSQGYFGAPLTPAQPGSARRALPATERSTSRRSSLIGSGLSSTCSRSTVSLCSQTPQFFLTMRSAADCWPRLSPPAGLPALERRDQPQRERTRGLLERLHHVGHDRLAGEDVPLRGAELPALVAGPRRRLRAGVGRVVPLRVHHRELAAGLRPGLAGIAGIRIAVEDRLDDRLGRRGRRAAAPAPSDRS